MDRAAPGHAWDQDPRRALEWCLTCGLVSLTKSTDVPCLTTATAESQEARDV